MSEQLAQAKFFEIVTSGAVETKVRQVHSFMESLNNDVVGSNVDVRFKNAWQNFFNAWKAFYEEYKGGCWFGCAGALDRAEHYEREAAEWQRTFVGFGGQSVAPPPSLPPKRGWWIPWVAGAAGLLAGAYIVHKVAPSIWGRLARRRRS